VPILRYVNSGPVSNPPNTQTEAVALCPPAAPYVVGGGVFASAANPGQEEVNTSYPLLTIGWDAFVDNLSANFTYTIFAFAICTNSNNVAGPVSSFPRKG
jgi:hypothetical protein